MIDLKRMDEMFKKVIESSDNPVMSATEAAEACEQVMTHLKITPEFKPCCPKVR